MSIRYFIVIALLGIVGYSNNILATSFTAAQLAEIKELLRQEREKVRSEILAEIKGQEQNQQEVQEDVDSVSLVEEIIIKRPRQKGSLDTAQREEVGQNNMTSASKVWQSEQSSYKRKNTFYGEIKPKDGMKKASPMALSEAEINQNTDASKAIFTLSRQISDSYPDNKAYYSAFSLKASAPIDKNNNEFINLASLDGLTNAFDLEFSYSRIYVNNRRRPLDENGQLIPGFIKICKLVEIDVSNGETCDTNAVKRGLTKIEQLDLYPEFVSYFWGPRAWKFSYEINGKIGVEEFNFFDPVTLMKRDQDENPWTLGIKAKLVPLNFNALFMLEYTHQNAYKAANSATACPVSLGTTPTVCITGNIGAPTRNIKRLLAFETRKEFSDHNWGLALKVTHDFENNDTGLELPLYLFKDSEENLSGGIRLGWTNTDSITAGMFAESEFKLFD